MISFNYDIEFRIQDEATVSKWISNLIEEENYKEGEINYIFCSDDYLHKINVDFLNHDTLTDVISFDYSVGKELHGDIYISIERVADNAEDYKVLFLEELHRVMIHGVLHLCGYKDKSIEEEKQMRMLENKYLNK